MYFASDVPMKLSTTRIT